MPSTAVPAAVQTSFVFLCACSAESYAAAPAIVRLGKKKKGFFEGGGSKDIRNRLQKA